jgi:hypothetical protein
VSADQYIPTGSIYISEFESMLLSLSSIRYLTNLGFLEIPAFGYDYHRSRIQAGFEGLERVAVIPGPKFVFAHIILPHPPFVFATDGTPIQADWDFRLSDGSHFEGTSEQYVQGYRNQIQYTNKLVVKAINEIITHSKSPPFIILQADHGPGAYFDYESIENTCLRERTSILNAYYLPDIPTGLLYDSISPVNSFRLISDEYFGTEFGLLADRTYYSTNTHPYDFTEVRDLIGDQCDIP